MTTLRLPDYGPPNLDFARPAEPGRLERVARSLEARGVRAVIADSAEHAKQVVLDLVPEGAEVHIALSETMAKLGLSAEIDESGRYDSIRSKLKKLDRQTQHREMRKLGAAPDYMLGSAHAITDDGVILVASGSGSQLGAHAYAAGNVILAVGHQKIVHDLPEGLRRIREYSLPLEDARMKALGRPGSALMKTLIIEGDPGGRITVVLIPETIGF
jgi:acetolactate synthase regulatory subunit